MYFVYVLEHPQTHRRYIGSTSNLDRRLHEHRFQHPGYSLIYSESKGSKEAAYRCEPYLKTGHGRKYLTSLLHNQTLQTGSLASTKPEEEQ